MQYTVFTTHLPYQQIYKELMRTLTEKPVNAEMLDKIWNSE